MRKHLRLLSVGNLLILWVSIILSPVLCFAGAWPQEKGKGFMSLAFSRYQTTRGTTASGDVFQYNQSGKYIGDRIELYFEQGLGNDVNLVGSFSYVSNSYRSLQTSQENEGFPDQQIGISYSLSSHPNAFTLGLAYYYPFFYTLDRQPLLGFKQHALQLTASGGHGFKFGEWNSWIDGDIGYRHYFGSVSDQLHATLRVGTRASERWIFVLQILGTESFHPRTILQSLNPDISSGYSVLKASGSVGFNILPSLSIVGSYTKDLWGKRSGYGHYVSVAVWYWYELF